MSIVWLSKVKWETVWAALHHIMVRQDFTVKTPSARLSGTGTGARLHIDLPGTAASAGGSPYTGYFAIMDVSDATGKKVVIADGADGKGANVCYVNNNKFTVPAATYAVTGSMSFYIQYTPAATGSGTCTLQTGSMPASVNNGNVYWEIGSVKIENGALVITQRHYGIVNMMYLGCKDVI